MPQEPRMKCTYCSAKKENGAGQSYYYCETMQSHFLDEKVGFCLVHKNPGPLF